jgi:nitroreductase
MVIQQQPGPAAESTSPDRAALSALAAAIIDRRSVKAFSRRPVSRALLAELIDLAVWAPNHRLNEPWRFYVLDGASRASLGDIARRVTLARFDTAPGADPARTELRAAQAEAEWAATPALVYLSALSDPKPEVDRENYAAACCAAQNLMLAATSVGLATFWSSGAVARSAELRAFVGATPREQFVGLFRVGYPDPELLRPVGRRNPGARFTVWVDGAADAPLE